MKSMKYKYKYTYHQKLEYNINVNLKMIEMDGRILDAPDILYSNPNIMKSNQIASKGLFLIFLFKIIQIY